MFSLRKIKLNKVFAGIYMEQFWWGRRSQTHFLSVQFLKIILQFALGAAPAFSLPQKTAGNVHIIGKKNNES